MIPEMNPSETARGAVRSALGQLDWLVRYVTAGEFELAANAQRYFAIVVEDGFDEIQEAVEEFTESVFASGCLDPEGEAEFCDRWEAA